MKNIKTNNDSIFTIKLESSKPFDISSITLRTNDSFNIIIPILDIRDISDDTHFIKELDISKDIWDKHNNEYTGWNIFVTRDISDWCSPVVVTCDDSSSTRFTALLDELNVRPLSKRDSDQIKELDDESVLFKIYDFIEDMLEDENQDYAYGIFNGNRLLGYCTIGGADEIDDADNDDLLLGDVYIKDDYQTRGLGSLLVNIVNKSQHLSHSP